MVRMQTSANFSVTPDTLIKLPNINIPIRAVVDGNIKITSKVTMIGNNIFSSCDTGRNCCILIIRSSFDVRARIIGGCIIGTNDIYEYAATAIGANKWGANLMAVYMAVGPSAPPIIAMDAASPLVKPKASAPKRLGKYQIVPQHLIKTFWIR